MAGKFLANTTEVQDFENQDKTSGLGSPVEELARGVSPERARVSYSVDVEHSHVRSVMFAAFS